MNRFGRFLISGLTLTATSLLLRTVGVSFHAFITARVGAAATGLYQLTMSVYSPALTLATAGVNLAASRLVAEELGKRRGGRPRAVLRRCLIYAGCLSLPVGLLLFLLTPYISHHWLGSCEAETILHLLSVSLPFIALSSAMNGYFTAIRRATKTASIQLIEQGFKIALTLFLLSRHTVSGIACLITVVFVNVTSDLLSCLLTALLCHREIRRGRDLGRRERGSVTARILSVTLPLSISSFLRSGLVATEHLLIPRGLRKSGVPYEEAMASYGALSGMALPILLFPASFLYSFLGLLIPELAEAKERGKEERIAFCASAVLRTVLVFGIGAAGLLFAFAGELGQTLYRSAEAAKYLLLLAPLIPVMYLDTAVDSMLKGLGEQIFTMKVNVLDALISVCAVSLLVPRMGILGYVAVIILSEMINFGFSLWRLKRVTGVKPRFLRQLLLPLWGVLGAMALSRLIALPLSGVMALTVGLGSGVLFYLLFLLWFGILPLRVLKAVWQAIQSELLCHRDKGIIAKDGPYNEAVTTAKEHRRAAS